MVFSYKKNKILFSIFFGVAVALVGYTNCSDKSFSVSNETTQRILSEGSSIFINNDDAYTNNTSVNLTIENNSADEMYVTNTKDCSAGGQWETYSTSKLWVLAESNARAKAYIKFREKNSRIESTCTWDSIVHDNIAPTLTIVQAAPTITNNTALSFRFASADNLSGVRSHTCKDNQGQDLANCQESISLTGITEGPGSVTVVAEDNAGNISAPLTQTWIADFTPPKAFINSTPSAISNNMSGSFTFSGTDNFSNDLQFECKINSGNYAACTSPYNFNLNEGTHTFTVRSKDNAGNFSTPVSYTWAIDLSAPTVRILTMPLAFSNLTTGAFTFDGMDDGIAITRFECKMDSGAFTICASPSTHSGLANGSHTFQVRGYDSAGNVSAPASYTWVIDTLPPTVQISSQPRKETNQNTAVFQFIATDSETSIQLVECRLNGAAFQTCNSLSAQYTDLAQGTHTFEVRAKDIAGNTSAVVSYSWTVDLTPPVLSFIKTPLRQTKDPLAVFEIRATDNSTGAISLECKLDNGSFAPCTSNQAFTPPQDGNHNFSVRARDTAGNLSSDLTYTWLIDTMGPAINFTSIPAPMVGILENPEIGFIVTDIYSNVTSIQCGFQGQLGSCPAIYEMVYNNLQEGNYTFVVNAADSLGNTSTNSVQFSVTNNIRQVSQDITVTVNNKADILIVIDNSISMSPEQANMAQRFSTFLNQIEGLDWRVGIITTDMNGNADKKDGRFLAFNKDSFGGKQAPDFYFIHSGMDRNAAKDSFAKTIQRPANEGHGYEQGIAASLRAIQRSLEPTTIAASAPNRAFFRGDAVLSVVVVSDDDETNGFHGTQIYNTPQNWYNYVRNLWPTKPFSFHSIVVRSGDASCLAVDGNENYGVAYETLSALTGGVVGSVCANDYGSQLSQIGQSVVNLRRTVNLTCPPVNQNKNGTLLDDVVVTLQSGSTMGITSVSGQTLTTASDLPAGTHRIDYWCY